jgi:hypothetical protein
MVSVRDDHVPLPWLVTVLLADMHRSPNRTITSGNARKEKMYSVKSLGCADNMVRG